MEEDDSCGKGSDIDVLKLNTSMNLFNRVSPNDVFAEVIEAFF